MKPKKGWWETGWGQFAMLIVTGVIVVVVGVIIERMTHHDEKQPSAVHIEASGDKSPVVQGNQGSVQNSKSGTHLQPTNITQGSGSIAQVGGTGNTATVNNGPPPLEFSVAWERRADNMSGCPRTTTDVILTPNQPVSAPFELGFDLDTPTSLVGESVKGANFFMGGGHFRTGYHPSGTFGIGIDPRHPAVMTVCTETPIGRVTNPHIEGR